MIKTILVPTDGSEHAEKAVAFGADLAKKYDAKLLLLHVMKELGSDRIPEGLREYARAEHIEVTERDILESVARQIVRKAEVVARDHEAPELESALEFGDPATSILESAARKDADLIVMGPEAWAISRDCSLAASRTRSATSPTVPVSRLSELRARGP